MMDLKKYNKTRSIFELEDRCVCFIKSEKFLHHLEKIEYDICVIAPKKLAIENEKFSKNVKFFFVENPKYFFTTIHNKIYKDFVPLSPIIGKRCKIHSTVIMDVDGMRLSRLEDGNWKQFIHTGNVVIEDDVDIGAYTVIHRGTFGNTLIKKDVKIGTHNNIGHNTIIGEHVIITTGVTTGGSSVIGDRCLLGMGAIIRNGVHITDDVTIGMGAVVTKDASIPGTYIGNPAKFIDKKYSEF